MKDTKKKAEAKDLVLFEDSFGVQHIARITNITGSTNRKIRTRNINVIILASVEESNLNTSVITNDEIILIFEDCKDLIEVEDKYPECWI